MTLMQASISDGGVAYLRFKVLGGLCLDLELKPFWNRQKIDDDEGEETGQEKGEGEERKKKKKEGSAMVQLRTGQHQLDGLTEKWWRRLKACSREAAVW